MTRTFKITFTNNWNGKTVEIITKVTDRMEERRKMHKKAYATEKAVRKFAKDHIRFHENEERGYTVIDWIFETVEI